MIELEELHRLFVVDLRGGKLFWKEPPLQHQRLRGREAGTRRKSHVGKPYWHVKIGGKSFKRSHLIYLGATGKWPHPCVDHINGNSEDDSAANLREATALQNAWNHKTRKRSEDLPMGIRSLPSGRFQARIGYMGRQIHLGSHASIAAAVKVYSQKRRELYGEFA